MFCISARNRVEKKRTELEKTWLCAAKLQLGLAHQTVRWCTGQCPVRAGWSTVKRPLSGVDRVVRL
jgi:hypothetical protein